MDNTFKLIAGGMLVLGLMSGAAACSSNSGADVLQYGYYNPQHVYIVYPTPHIVHVSSSVYNSNHTMYSSPTVEKTYVKTHTVTTTQHSNGSVSTSHKTTTTTKTTKRH